MTANPLLRAAYWAVWFVLLPAALVALTLWLLTPYDEASFALVRFAQAAIDSQPVPSAIVLFAIFEMILWSQRHALPLAPQAGIGGRGDIPVAARKRVDQAQRLIEEAGRIQRRHHKAIEQSVRAVQREKLAQSLSLLRDEITKDVFDSVSFEKAWRDAEMVFRTTLSPWRKGEVRDLAESILVAVLVALLLRTFVVEAFKIPSRSMVPTLAVGDHIFVNKFAYGPMLPFTETRIFNRMPPGRGDVIVFQYPEQPQQDFIKRVVGIPGDHIEAIDGRPRINGWLVPRCLVGDFSYDEGVRHSGELYVEYLGERAYPTFFDHSVMGFRERLSCRVDGDCAPGQGCADGVCGDLEGPFVVADGEAFVMGDNRMNSHDSRGWFERRGGGVPFPYIRGSALWIWMSFSSGGSFAWDRIGVSVMGMPKLPEEFREKIGSRLAECIRSHPGVAAATPPVR